MKLIIRKAETGDFETIYQFICELQNKAFDKDQMRVLYHENITSPNFVYLLATLNESILGYLSCHTQILLHHAGKVAEIQEMFVKPEYRSAGVGKQLMDEIKKITREAGVLQLEVTTRTIRENAIKFYKRESFEDSHKKLVYYFQEH